MSARPDHAVRNYFSEFVDKLVVNEELQTVTNDSYTIKLALLFGKRRFYLEYSNLEHKGVRMILYKSNVSMHSKQRSIVEITDLTFKEFANQDLQLITKLLEGFNSIF